MQNDLANPAIKWLILVNPPYATAQEAGLQGKSKEGVSDTTIRKLMHTEGLGEVSRELYVQFLYRIINEFKHRQAVLGLFAPLKYLVSTNYQKFRDNVFCAKFHSGFIFSSENFGGTSKSKHFPVSFILWNIGDGSRDDRRQTTDDRISVAAMPPSLLPSAVCRLPSAVYITRHIRQHHPNNRHENCKTSPSQRLFEQMDQTSTRNEDFSAV